MKSVLTLLSYGSTFTKDAVVLLVMFVLVRYDHRHPTFILPRGLDMHFAHPGPGYPSTRIFAVMFSRASTTMFNKRCALASCGMFPTQDTRHQHIHLDIIGPLLVSRGFSCIISLLFLPIMIGHFTRFSVIVLIQNSTVATEPRGSLNLILWSSGNDLISCDAA